MQRYISIFIFLLHWACIHSQSDTTYSRIFYYVGGSSTTLNGVSDIFRLGNRTYLVLTNGDVQQQFHTIVEIDEFGNALNQMSLYYPGGDLIIYPGSSVLVDSDSNIVIVSSVSVLGPDPIDGYIAKLTKDLDTIWTHTYTIPPLLAGCPADTVVGNYFTAVRQAPDGGYIIPGGYRLNCQYGTIYDRACLFKINTAGYTEWWQVYPNHITSFEIEMTSDSGFIFLEAKNPGLSLIKVDKSGDYQWSASLDNTYLHKLGQGIEIVNDSMVAIAGNHVYNTSTSLGYSGIDFFIFNLNSKTVVASHYYEPYMTVRTALLHQNLKLQIVDDGYIIAATAMVLSPDSIDAGHKGIIMKLGPQGDSIWTRYYTYGDFEDVCQFNDVMVMDDGGFLVAGFYFPWTSNYAAWLVRTDSNGYAPGSYPTGIEKPIPMPSSFSLYPNPTDDRVWVDVGSANGSVHSGKVSIMDCNSNEVRSLSFKGSSNRFELNTSGLSSGLYLVSVILENGQIITKKLIVK